MVEEAMDLLALEEALHKDDDGSLHNQLLNEYNERARHLKQTIDAGVTSAEFERLQKLRLAMEAAATTVDRLWQRFHSK
jgi:hypothetical protein